ncbi:MAG: hypothetical protein KAJ88_02900 [Candidatus Aenigmarchaeota archaeon]|nr:hypothetical protein [Candidatus Aenigmarchaeota archaeon]
MSSQTHYGLYGGLNIPKKPAYRIEITPKTNANGTYQPASLSDIYTQIVPSIEKAIGGKTNVGVNRSGKDSIYEFVIVVAPTGKTKRDLNHLESTIETIKEQYPEWADSLNVVARKEREIN